MDKDIKIPNNSPPGHTLATDRKEPQETRAGISIQKKEFIPEITISNSEQGITIEYEPGFITEKGIEQLLQKIINEEAIVTPETPQESKTHTIRYYSCAPQKAHIFYIFGVHFEQNYPQKTHFKATNSAEAYQFLKQQLEKTNINSLISTLRMKEVEEQPTPPVTSVVEEAKKPTEQTVLPLLGLHQALEEARAYEKIKKPKNRQVLEAYLTTEDPMGDLKGVANVKSVDAVYSIVHRNLQKVFVYLPPEIQKQYGGSAKEAIKLKSSTQLQTRTSRGRIKEGLTNKRWQRYREVERPQGKPAFSEQGLENIRRVRSNTPRENYSKAANHRWELYREQQSLNAPTQEPRQIPPEQQTIVDLTKPSQKH